MAQAPALSSEISRIVDELQREHEGDPWHGSPLKAILQGIDAQRAAARPLADAHSIWELVLHMTSWKNETARRIRGAVACMPIEGDWPDDWIGDRRPLAASERATRSRAQGFDRRRQGVPRRQALQPTNDTRSAPLGTGVSHYVLLHGIVQHDVYHAGQIALLKKAR